jgi:antitoxin component YwqK of YwqJK toxin-antitoxin module
MKGEQNKMTKVIFRKDKKANEIMAFFPETMQHGMLDCYAHIGQHSTADIQYYWSTKPAGETEYKKLHQELISIGYDDLKICKKITYRKGE